MPGVPPPAAQTLHGVTSQQVEARCFASPGFVVPAKIEMAQAPCCKLRPPRVHARPTPNTLDLPDIGLAGTRAGKSRGLSRKQGRRSALELVPEDYELSGSEETGDEEAEAPWECAACTFSNAGAMPSCEMCAKPRSGPSIARRALRAASAEKGISSDADADAWPSLLEATDKSWTLCEVSSVGSSWLDVGDTGQPAEDDDVTSSSVSFLVLGEVPASEPAAGSWAALAAAGPRPRTSEPPAAPAPPLWHERRKGCGAAVSEKSKDAAVDAGELGELEERRLHPTTLRGIAQRRRRDRRSVRRC